jgi:signal transduction histidine kinase
MQPTDPNIIAKTLSDDRHFSRQWSLFWCIALTIYMVADITGVLISEPFYQHNWRIVPIMLLSLAVVALYIFGTFYDLKSWPPPFLFACTLWMTMYVCMLLLIWIDNNFIYAMYVVFGFTFLFFYYTRSLVFISIIFVTLCLVKGLLIWPLSGDAIIGIIVFALTIYGTSIFSIILQRLISARFERSDLLAQLSQVHTALAEAHRQLADSAEREQELAVLRERARLAREMHDTLGHALVLVSVKLEAAQRLRERDPARCDHELEETKTIVRHSMSELRASIANLRSPVLVHETVACALSRYAHEIAQRSSWQVTCAYSEDLPDLPEYIADALLKIGQEALTNVEKHSDATHVTLCMQPHKDSIRLCVQDDGIGLPHDLYKRHPFVASPPQHYGLSGMAERALNLDGMLSLLPAIPHGTIVEVEFPLIEQHANVAS